MAEKHNATAEQPVPMMQILKPTTAVAPHPFDEPAVAPSTSLVEKQQRALDAAQQSQQKLQLLLGPIRTPPAAETQQQTPLAALAALMVAEREKASQSANNSTHGSSAHDKHSTSKTSYDADAEAGSHSEEAEETPGGSHASVGKRLKKITTIFARKSKKDKKDKKKKTKKDKKAKKAAAVAAVSGLPPLPTSTNKEIEVASAPGPEPVDASLPFPTMNTPAEETAPPPLVLETHYYEERVMVDDEDMTEQPSTTSLSLTHDEAPPTATPDAAGVMLEESVARMMDDQPILPPVNVEVSPAKAPPSPSNSNTSSKKHKVTQVEQLELDYPLTSTLKKSKSGTSKRSSSKSNRKKSKQQTRRNNTNDTVNPEDDDLGDEIEQLFACCQEEFMNLVAWIPPYFTSVVQQAPASCDATDMALPRNTDGCGEAVKATFVTTVGAVTQCGATMAGGMSSASMDDGVSVLTEDDEAFLAEEEAAAEDDLHMVVVTSKDRDDAEEQQEEYQAAEATAEAAPATVEDIVDQAFARDGMVVSPEGEEQPEPEQVAAPETAMKQPKMEQVAAPEETEEESKVEQAAVPETSEEEQPKVEQAAAPEEAKAVAAPKEEEQPMTEHVTTLVEKVAVGPIAEIPEFKKPKNVTAGASVATPVKAKKEKKTPVVTPVKAKKEKKTRAATSARNPVPSKDLKDDGEIVFETSQTIMSALTGADQSDVLHMSPAPRASARKERNARRQMSSRRQDIEHRDDGFFDREDKTEMMSLRSRGSLKSGRTGLTLRSGRSRRDEGLKAEMERLRAKRRHKKNSNTAPGNDEIEKAHLCMVLSSDSGVGVAKGNAYPLLDELEEEDEDDMMAIRAVDTDKSIDLGDMIRDALQRADRTLNLAHHTTAE